MGFFSVNRQGLKISPSLLLEAGFLPYHPPYSLLVGGGKAEFVLFLGLTQTPKFLRKILGLGTKDQGRNKGDDLVARKSWFCQVGISPAANNFTNLVYCSTIKVKLTGLTQRNRVSRFILRQSRSTQIGAGFSNQSVEPRDISRTYALAFRFLRKIVGKGNQRSTVSPLFLFSSCVSPDLVKPAPTRYLMHSG
ncbi:hypothetical protein MiSe_45340 [Microseira wollei NIES-4236]|uniref:Uncharacterized protein n=1 Tax=Microseira wollei NIES-4236 TaxID=2530354 RepID=A0AAV3XJU6_9CYAN|nr:hypothetical protein MiSe_45340 [Microseira wollei NIES-4236]